eukprot:1805161-Pleurochrysis_carterae.AAC.1
MVLSSPAELAKIKTEWEAVFDTLPPEAGDTNALPAGKKLVWSKLPRVRYGRPASAFSSARSVGGVSSALENPVINPITGLGRASADARVRRDAENTPYPAVFQADYLFVQLTNGELELHRVAHGLIIENATAPCLSFSTSEYRHFPQPGVPGFWGNFSLAPNPAYDERDPRKGP